MKINRLVCLLMLLVFASCTDSYESKYQGPLDLPPSTVSFDIHFPASELQEGINSHLKKTLIDDQVPLNKRGDKLFLEIERTGKLEIGLSNGRAHATIPLNVKAAVRKKVMGITFSNKDVPVEFTGTLRATARVDMDSAWNIALECESLDLDWDSQPKINLLGLDVDISGYVEKALNKNENLIMNSLCLTVNQSLDFRKVLGKVWNDIQKPIRIAKRPDSLWLYAKPETLSAGDLLLEKDLLSLHVELKTDIHITTNKKIPIRPVGLPLRTKPLTKESAILAYLEAKIPVNFIEEIMQDQLTGREMDYQDYHIKIGHVNLSTQDERLKVSLKTSGDISGNITVLAIPTLDDEKKLKLENLDVSIETDSQTSLADWAGPTLIESYLSTYFSLDLNPFLSTLDEKANAGIAKSRLGSKLETQLDFANVSLYGQRLAQDTLRLIFYVEGTAGLKLKDGVFEKKRRTN